MAESQNGLGVVQTARGDLHCPLPSSIARGTKTWVTVRPESFLVSATKLAGKLNVLEGRIEKAVFLGDLIDCQIAVGEQAVRAKLHPASDLSQGDRVYLHFEPGACILLPIVSD